MKKGFSLTETLISLAIIAVLAALLVPMFISNSPNKEAMMYKKAIYTLQAAVDEAWNDFVYSPSDANNGIDASGDTYWKNIDGVDFCKNVVSHMNVMQDVSCSSGKNIAGFIDEPQEIPTPDIITANGIKWWGLADNKFTDSVLQKTIYVDVNGDSRPNQVGVDILKININYDGKVTILTATTTDTATGTDWSTENKYLKDFTNSK